VGSFGTAGRLAITASICDQQPLCSAMAAAARPGESLRHRRAARWRWLITTSPPARHNKSRSLENRRCAAHLCHRGGVYDAASAINWARGLGLFDDYAGIDDFAAPPAIERGIVFVPALSGLAAPYWDRNAAGMWLGIG
jgi:glycerol kinase